MNPGGPKFLIVNREFVWNSLFRKACELAKVQPTKRQASKWRNSRGPAFAKRHEAMRELNESGTQSRAI